MPDVKVYVRSEDLDKWNAIPKKSEWLHNALNGRLKHLEKQPARVETRAVDDTLSSLKVIKTPEDSEKAIQSKGWSGSIPKSYSARKKK